MCSLVLYVLCFHCSISDRVCCVFLLPQQWVNCSCNFSRKSILCVRIHVQWIEWSNSYSVIISSHLSKAFSGCAIEASDSQLPMLRRVRLIFTSAVFLEFLGLNAFCSKVRVLSAKYSYLFYRLEENLELYSVRASCSIPECWNVEDSLSEWLDFVIEVAVVRFSSWLRHICSRRTALDHMVFRGCGMSENSGGPYHDIFYDTNLSNHSFDY